MYIEYVYVYVYFLEMCVSELFVSLRFRYSLVAVLIRYAMFGDLELFCSIV